jgi:SOS response regulatory protein OraA/RecX
LGSEERWIPAFAGMTKEESPASAKINRFLTRKGFEMTVGARFGMTHWAAQDFVVCYLHHFCLACL